MKKKSEQLTVRRRPKDQLGDSRRIEPNLHRPVAALDEKPSILIVCEGENTEPSYFNQFRLSSATVKSIGEGYNTVSLVNRTIKLVKDKHYDQIWCVFDKDDFDEQNFNNAVHQAKKQKFGVAYSNQSFEYWLILHFDDHQGGKMHRKDYNSKINDLLKPFGITYDGNGNKKISEAFFEILEGVDPKTKLKRINLATKRAKRNLRQFDHTNPANEESSTTVFKLTEQLMKYI